MIPKIIWTYWHSIEKMPDFVKKCIDTWRFHNSDYIINVVTSKTLSKYVGFEETYKIKHWKFMDSAQRMSDLVRLSILNKYGGIWMDASCVCFESLDWVNSYGKDVIIYQIPEIKVPESWFIACTRENEYIQKVNKEFREEIPRFDSIDEYISKCMNTDGLDFDFNYLLIYLVLNKFLMGSEKIIDASTGPYLYQRLGGISSIPKIKKFPRFFKFRKDERSEMTNEIENVLFMIL
jgi:hypothetical protein